MARKIDSLMVMRPSTHRYLASTKLLFGFLVARKLDSSRVMRHLAEEYMASVEQLFIILAA
jgi:hypothetical protein